MAAAATEWLESSAEDEKGCGRYRRLVRVELEELAETARLGQPKHEKYLKGYRGLFLQ